MTRTWKLAVAVAVVVTLLATTGSYAAKLKIGEPAPDWSGIVGVDDKDHGLSDYKRAKVVVMVFTCNHCPVAVVYEDRLIALQKEYKKKGVQFVAVNVNNNPLIDRLEGMKVRAKEKEFNFPYLYDSSQKIGHDYGATVTPHIFLLGTDRKVAYTGAVDDSNRPGNVEKHYLREALDAVLAGKEPATTQTKERGCTVKYE